MEVDKYQVLIMLEALAKQDDQCSMDCDGCRYEEVCNRLSQENILEKLFN